MEEKICQTIWICAKILYRSQFYYISGHYMHRQVDNCYHYTNHIFSDILHCITEYRRCITQIIEKYIVSDDVICICRCLITRKERMYLTYIILTYKNEQFHACTHAIQNIRVEMIKYFLQK